MIFVVGLLANYRCGVCQYHLIDLTNSNSLLPNNVQGHSKVIALLVSVSHMMTSSNGNIFRVTGHLCGEFTGPR